MSAKIVVNSSDCLSLSFPDRIRCEGCTKYKDATMCKPMSRRKPRTKAQKCCQYWKRAARKGSQKAEAHEQACIFLENEGYTLGTSLVATALVAPAPAPELGENGYSLPDEEDEAPGLISRISISTKENTASTPTLNHDIKCGAPLKRGRNNSSEVVPTAPVLPVFDFPTVRSPQLFLPFFEEERQDKDIIIRCTRELTFQPPPGGQNVYWNSTNAHEYVKPKLEDGFCPKAALHRYVKKLYDTASDVNGYRKMIEGGDENGLSTTKEISQIQKQVTYLYEMYKIALEKPGVVNWKNCCKEAVDKLKDHLFHGAKNVKCPDTIMEWHRRFREKEFLVNDAKLAKRSGPRLPAILRDHEDIALPLNQYLNLNIGKVNSEYVSAVFDGTVFPYLSAENILRDATDKEELLKLPTFEGFLLLNHDKETKSPKNAIETLKSLGIQGIDNDELQAVAAEIKLEYGLTAGACQSTIVNWMNAMGFSWETRKKNFYTDTHESPSNVAARLAFGYEYEETEFRCYRWIQMPLAEAEHDYFATNKLFRDNGYRYEDENGIEMIEFHVDDREEFQEKMLLSTLFGGKLSVRMPVGAIPLFVLGHDECIFKQFLFSTKTWVGSDGSISLVPKDEGQGLMCSTFVSRDHGWGGVPSLTVEQLGEVNESRLGKKYTDEEAAMKTINTPWKKALTIEEHGGNVYFEYGASKEGYWSYDHLVLQLEDLVDVLKVIAPGHMFVFYFDHSCGHDRQQINGLNVNDIGKAFGGAQKIMRDSIMTEGTLGKHAPTLCEGDVQKMVWPKNPVLNDGPWEIKDPFVRNAKMNDHRQKFKALTKKELKARLLAENIIQNDLIGINRLLLGDFQELALEAGISFHHVIEDEGPPSNRPCTNKELIEKLLAFDRNLAKDNLNQKRKAALVQMCEHLSLPIVKDGRSEGWAGKAKGALQIARERGLLDLTAYKLNQFTMDGIVDKNTGKVDLNTSLKHLVGECDDFKNEVSQLTKMGELMGVEVRTTPKVHCELAGEGIEYGWGNTKNAYRRLELRHKRKKNLFHDSVKRCSKVMTLAMVRKNARRARAYTKTYCILDRLSEQNGVAGGISQEFLKLPKVAKLLKEAPGTVTLPKVEQLVKIFKTHRNAEHFDTAACRI